MDWDKLRADPDIKNSFEELCCQLARAEPVPLKDSFTRTGSPDAGLECYWTLQDGSEWGWQAKYFRTSPNSNQWTQIDNSVKKALETHPNLTKYYVCMPIDRSDGKQMRQNSFLTKWKQHVNKWRRIKKISFLYWGSSEIEQRLNLEQHSGRCMYFFDREFLTKKWFTNHINDSIKDASVRYSPEINLELAIAEAFETLGQTPSFVNKIKKIVYKIKKRFKYIKSKLSQEMEEPAELESAVNTVTNVLTDINTSEQMQIDLDQIRGLTKQILKIVDHVLMQLAEKKEKVDRYDQTHLLLQMFQSPLLKLEQWVEEGSLSAVNTGALLVRGNAGIGKTHLFCDIARQRLHNNRFSVLLHGGHFVRGNPKETIIKELGLNCKFEDLLRALDAAGQASGYKSLIMIDALNEGDGRHIWPCYLQGILSAISRYRWVGIAVSVRSTYEPTVIPEGIAVNELTRITHNGFEGRLEDAIKLIFDNNDLERPRIPILRPEFSNPQFLILLATGLKNRNEKKMPPELYGMSSIYDFYIDSINTKLSKSSRLDYPAHRKIVYKAIDKLALYMACKNTKFLRYEDADKILSKVYHADADSKSLVRNLILENLLNEECLRAKFGADQFAVQFAYERLADDLIVGAQLAGKSEGDVAMLLRDNEFIKNHISIGAHQNGILDAMSRQIPEKFGKELIEMAPELARSTVALNAFLDSLMWRGQRSIFCSTLQQIEKHILTQPHLFDKFFEVLLTISIDPSSRLNGHYLYNYLLKFSMNKRDLYWSSFLYRNYYDGDSNIVKRYIDWALRVNRSTLSQESVYLVALTLPWFFTSSQRSIRDKATKALVSILADRIDTLVDILIKLENCSDLYVTERLYCVAYGCAVRSHDVNQLKKLADYVYLKVFKNKNQTPNIRLQDYAKEIIDYAIYRGADIYYKPNPPYGSTWLEDIPTNNDVENLRLLHSGTTQHNDGAHGIFRSMSPFGDFYRYVMSGNLNDFEWSNVKLQNGMSREAMLTEFINTLNNRQCELWNDYYNCLKELWMPIHNKVSETVFNTSKISDMRVKLLNKLNINQTIVFNQHIDPYLKYSFCQTRQKFDLQSLARWITRRVFDMGWTRDRFGKYDQYVDQLRFSKSNDDSERIGKKYQWIAYFELLARLNDNFEFSSKWGERAFSARRTAWQRTRGRDVDPTLVISDTCNKFINSQNMKWWFPCRYDKWDPNLDDANWLNDVSGINENTINVRVTNPSDDSQWLILKTNLRLVQQTPHCENVHTILQRCVDFSVRSFLIKKSSVREMCHYINEQDLNDIELNFNFISHIYLGELYWHTSTNQPEFSERTSWFKYQISPTQSTDVYDPTCSYFLSKSADYSINNDVEILLPNKLLVEKMDLKNLNDGTFVNAKNECITYDPAISEDGPSSLLVRCENFIQFLEKNKLDIIWYIEGQKMTLGDFAGSNNSIGIEVRGVYTIKNGRVIKKWNVLR